eukprot:scaffold78683_cov23-Tisochrysis_lutea.AAC.1
MRMWCSALERLLCKTSSLFRLQNVKAHEWREAQGVRCSRQQAQKDEASWQQPTDKLAMYIAQRHAGQAADPNLHI